VHVPGLPGAGRWETTAPPGGMAVVDWAG
jgi:hypothetical protein